MMYLKNKFLISLVILSILGLQFYFGTIKRASWYWPFIVYAMYSEKQENGATLDVEYQITTGFIDGATKNITKEDLGLSIFQWQWNIDDAFLRNDNKALEDFKTIIEKKYSNKLKYIELKDYPAKITKHGIEKKESIVIKRINY